MGLKVIGLVGLTGSGKTEVAKFLSDLGVPRVRMGDVVWRELKRRGREISETSVAELANELREREGMGAIAKRCIPLIRERGREKQAVVVDGIRGLEEVEEFRKAFGEDFCLWGVWAKPSTRYSRISGRGREDDAPERFREKDERELGWGLGKAFALADELVINEGSLEELHAQVMRCFGRVVG